MDGLDAWRESPAPNHGALGRAHEPVPAHAGNEPAAPKEPLFDLPEDCSHNWESVYASVRTIYRCGRCGEIDWS